MTIFRAGRLRVRVKSSVWIKKLRNPLDKRLTITIMTQRKRATRPNRRPAASTPSSTYHSAKTVANSLANSQNNTAGISSAYDLANNPIKTIANGSTNSPADGFANTPANARLVSTTNSSNSAGQVISSSSQRTSWSHESNGSHCAIIEDLAEKERRQDRRTDHPMMDERPREKVKRKKSMERRVCEADGSRVERQHYGTKPGHFETSIIHFPTSERCERTSERTSEWPSTYVSILVCSRPQSAGAKQVLMDA